MWEAGVRWDMSCSVWANEFRVCPQHDLATVKGGQRRRRRRRKKKKNEEATETSNTQRKNHLMINTSSEGPKTHPNCVVMA